MKLYPTRMLVIFQIVIAIATLSSSTLAADEPGFKFEAEASLYKSVPQALFYSVDFDLGELPVGKTGEVTLRIHNPFDRDVAFVDFRKICNCVSIESSSNEINALAQYWRTPVFC